MKSLGPKPTFPLSDLLEDLPTKIDYMPSLTQGQKLVAGGKLVEHGVEYLTVCTTDDEVDLMNDLYGKYLSWYIMPELAISVLIAPGVMVVFAEVVES